jgi:two-component system, OmpR family, sensor histidine kinase VicK
MLYILIIAGVFSGVAIFIVLFMARKKRAHAGQKGPAHVLAADLRDEKLKSEIILKAIEDGVVLLDDQRTIQLFNPAAGTITGWDPAQATGIDYKMVLKLINEKGEPYAPEKDPFNIALTEKRPVRDNTASLETRSKSVLSLGITVSPLMDAAGNISGAVGVFRDISEERKEGQQRAEFVSTASHEMRTPVAAIEGYLALALNDKVSTIDTKARNFLEKAHESTQHLGQLFQDLLTSAKAEDGRLTNHPIVVEVSSMLESLTDGLKFAAQKKSLSVEFVLGAPNSVIDASGGNVIKPLYYVLVDPDRIREVITNLFDNAVKYTDAGKITLGLTGDDSVVQLRISDTGHGIKPEDTKHLFEKFYRVDNSNTRTVGGTGLGLFICRKIVELYNGRIWVDSEIEKGSTFYINLPRLSSDRAQVLMHEESAKASVLATK